MSGNAVHRFFADEGGAYTLWALYWFVLLIGVTGLAVDSSNGVRIRAIMQATADSAALAAVHDVPDEAAMVDSALAFTEMNMPGEVYGDVLTPEDIVPGRWNFAKRTFAPGAAPLNAVRVTLRKTSASGNPVPVNFLRILGLRHWEMVVQATAVHAATEPCLLDGFVSRGRIYSGNKNAYADHICIHAREGVMVGASNSFETGVEVSMNDANDLHASHNNKGLDEALRERELDPPLVDMIPTIVQGLKDGSIVPPDFITQAPVFVDVLPKEPAPNTLYVVRENVDLGSNVSLRDIAIVTGGEIRTGANVRLSNVLLASLGEVTLGSNNRVGAADFCKTGRGEVYIFSQGDFSGGSHNTYSGVQIVGAGLVKLGSRLDIKSIAVQAGDDLLWGSPGKVGGCDAATLFMLEGDYALVE